MSKRLLKLRTIQQEKLERSRAWFWAEIAAGRFPKPVIDDLWDESEVDAAVAAYIERGRAADVTGDGKQVGRRLTKSRTQLQPA